MDYVVFFVAGVLAGALPLVIWYYAYVALLGQERRQLRQQADRLSSDVYDLSQRAEAFEGRRRQGEEAMAALDVRRRQVEERINATLAQQAQELAARAEAVEAHGRDVEEQFRVAFAKRAVELDEERRKHEEVLTARTRDLETHKRELDQASTAFEERKIRYDSLVRENTGLKQDLFNLSVQSKKTERDHAAIMQRQEEICQQANELAERYLSENVSWIGDKINATNFASSKTRLLKVIEWCRRVGFEIPASREEDLVQGVRKEYEEAVRAQFAREEQARIRAQIREEEKVAREIDKQVKDAQREQAAIQAALDKALAEARDEHSAEVAFLKSRLKEAEENMQRAMSRAQMTKSGHVYVLSNIGAFGEGVFKIGMSRRLEPQERVDELSGASVPFPFDVHMMISCDDAPSLENALHRELHMERVNKVNFRKEFFHTDLETIRKVVEAQHGEVQYVAEPAALQYRESTSMSPEDYEVVESTVQSAIAEHGELPEED
jgi:hypothetical protein